MCSISPRSRWGTPLPGDVQAAILTAYERLCTRLGREPELAVRSSATAEDLPEACFAGAAESVAIATAVKIAAVEAAAAG